ncbi:MAG: diguanylate cyclase, partial [Promethearchaeota archaeon]
ELSERIKQVELLNKIGMKIVSVSDLDNLLETVAAYAKKFLGYDNCAIFLIEGTDLILKSTYYFPKQYRGMKIPVGKGVVGKCIQKKELINISDISKCKFYIPSGLKRIQSEIALPIIYGKQPLGALTIESTKKEAFTKEDERMLGILSSQLGVAINKVRLTQSRFKEMELLRQAGLKIVSNIDLDKLLSIIVNLVRESLGYDNCAIFLPQGKKLILKAQSHFPKKVLGLEIKFGEGIVGRSAKRKKVINIGDVPKCDFYIPSGLKGIQSALALPILYENRLIGILATESRKKEAYRNEDVNVLTILSSQIGVALRNAEMLGELKKMSITDSLTGLYNYRYFRMRLEQETLRARRYNRNLSLILIDLDNFKMINDTFGHLKGDEILIAIAQLLLKNIRKLDSSSIMKEVEIDIPVRYGGEELMIIQPETPLQGAITAAKRLRTLIKKEINRKIRLIKENGKQLKVSGSIGVASLKTREKSDDLIKRVDQAMYEAKKRGKDQICWK